MKNTTFFLVTIILFTVHTQVDAQQTKTDSTANPKSLVVIDNQENPDIKTGAEIGAAYLEKAGTLLKTGMITPIISSTLGTILITQSKENIGVIVGYTTLAAGSITWIVCQITAGINMEKASRFLANPDTQYENIPLTVGATQNGFGLAYNF